MPVPLATPKVPIAAQRRAKAVKQATSKEWRQYAITEGIPADIVDLRRRVCGLPTNMYKFVIGMHAGDKGDTTQFGDPVIKCMGKLKRGRRQGQKDIAKRAPKRSRAEKASVKAAAAGHRVTQPWDSELDAELLDPVMAMASIDAPRVASPARHPLDGPRLHVPDTPDKTTLPTEQDIDCGLCLAFLLKSPSIKLPPAPGSPPSNIGGLIAIGDDDDDLGGFFSHGDGIL